MQLVTSVAEVTRVCGRLPRPVGLVPTMGALHDGHLSLVKLARRDNASLVATIFVNPTQFGDQEDLAAYPRDQEQDLELLRREGVDLAFAPSPEEIYPPGFNTWVEVPGLGDRLEGAHRPGHFRGVATVVTKLLSLFRPDTAYFGRKDGQQTAVIRRLNSDLNLGARIVVAPTVREADGLALSSRNAHLTPEQRLAAPVVYRALRAAEELWSEGISDGERLRARALQVLQCEALVEEIDYVSVADPDTMEELEQAARGAMLSTAVRIGRTRLIDNILLP